LATFLAGFACGALFAQENASLDARSKTVLRRDGTSAAPNAGSIIFSNLDSDGSYNIDTFAAKPVAGRQAGGGQTERWNALWFIPKVDVQVTTLSAAIGYISGTKLVNLALYDNDDILNIPRDPLPGGGGSTRNIPGFATGWSPALMTSWVRVSAVPGTCQTAVPTPRLARHLPGTLDREGGRRQRFEERCRG
jgi:hypothetical protein